MEFIILVLVVILILFIHSKVMSVNIIVAVEEVIGRWAVVTGATDGIGKAFAQELARLGCDIVLISRNQEKLDATARDVEVRFKVATKTIQADFSTLDEQMYSRIKSELEDLDVGVLVNNVGTSCEHPEYFLELEKHLGMSYQSMLNVNIASMVQMTSFVLPRMVQKHKGLIINVSSQASKMPTPLYTVYGATKSFVTKFSQDLDTECRTKGVHVHVLTTGLVTTKLSGVEKSSFISPSPQTYVKSALHEVTKKRSSDGYIGHQCVSAIAAIGTFLMPELMGNLVLKLLNYGKQFRGKNCNQCNSEKIK